VNGKVTAITMIAETPGITDTIIEGSKAAPTATPYASAEVRKSFRKSVHDIPSSDRAGA
jgi:hypothetical protein